MADDMSIRQPDLALVVARIDVDGTPHWLLRRHPKWGDWSLVGGHVEPDEVLDWMLTAGIITSLVRGGDSILARATQILLVPGEGYRWVVEARRA